MPLRDAVTIKDWTERGNLYVAKINEVRDLLWSEYDARGNLKSQKVLRAQREFSNYIADLFEVKNERNSRENLLRLDDFAQHEFITNQNITIESVILKFAKKALDDKIAAEKARNTAGK